jgi:vacuolar-type H+-ATPase subunit H
MANMENFPQNKGTSRFDTGSLGRQEGSAAAMTEKAKDAASSLIDKARDTASSVADQAKDTFSSVSDKARDFASSVSEKTSDVAHSISQQAGQVASRVNDTYESSRDYIQDRGLTGISADVTDIVRRNPLPALLLGLGVGFLIARALREE